MNNLSSSFKLVKRTVSYLICQFYHHDQNFTEQPAIHNLLHAFCHLIESLDFFSKEKVNLVT